MNYLSSHPFSSNKIKILIPPTFPSLFHTTTPWRENALKSKSPCFYWHNKIRLSFLLKLRKPRSLSFLSFSDSYSVSVTVTVSSDFWISSLNLVFVDVFPKGIKWACKRFKLNISNFGSLFVKCRSELATSPGHLPLFCFIWLIGFVFSNIMKNRYELGKN